MQLHFYSISNNIIINTAQQVTGTNRVLRLLSTPADQRPFQRACKPFHHVNSTQPLHRQTDNLTPHKTISLSFK